MSMMRIVPPQSGQGSLRVSGFAGAVGKDTVSRIWRKVQSDWEAWQKRDLAGEDIVRLILDGTVVKVRLDRQATSLSVLVGVRRDGQKVLLALRNMGGESEAAWRALLDDMVARSSGAYRAQVRAPGETGSADSRLANRASRRVCRSQDRGTTIARRLGSDRCVSTRSRTPRASAPKCGFGAAGEDAVNRRPKLTPYRRSRLTRRDDAI
jgi:hypothetical protein